MLEELFEEIDDIDIPEILSDLVSIPSYDSEQCVVEYIARRLSALGIRYEVTDVALDRQNLIASIGRGEGSLIFNTHTDTVPPGNIDDWSSPPLQLTRKGD